MSFNPLVFQIICSLLLAGYEKLHSPNLHAFSASNTHTTTLIFILLNFLSNFDYHLNHVETCVYMCVLTLTSVSPIKMLVSGE